MTELQPLFHLAPERELSTSEIMLKEWAEEVEGYTADQLEALKAEELITISDAESRVFVLNRLIEEKREQEN